MPAKPSERPQRGGPRGPRRERDGGRDDARDGGRELREGQRPDLRELIAYLTRALVDNPDTVEVTLVEEQDANVYEIEVDDEDLGKVIGKGGKTARAIRAIVGAVAPRRGKRTLVEILE
jgi:predicted RNA-binding protein YlqC (UPF0109 family)